MRHVIADETGNAPCTDCGSEIKKFHTGIEDETLEGYPIGTQCKVTIITIRHYIDCRWWKPADGYRQRPKPQEGDN